MSTDPAPASIPAAFRTVARGIPQADALVLPNGARVSYGQLDGLSDQGAAALAAAGVCPGDRVGLLCPNGPDFAAAYLAIQKCGGVVTPLNLLLNPKEQAYILNDAAVRGLIYHAAFQAGAAALRSAARPPWTACFQIGGDAPPAADGQPWQAACAAQADNPPPAPPLTRADLAAILYTAGTTGYPKGAMLSHGNLLSNIAGVAEALALTPGQDRILTVLPMFHAFAATAGLLYPLLHGLSLVPLPRFDPKETAETIAARQVTVFLGVPSMYNLLLQLPSEYTAKLSGLTFCFSGGAALPQEIMAAFERRFRVPIYEGDGPTECAPVTCVNPIRGARKPGSVGLPLHNVQMKIMDDRGREAPRNTIGEICVRGPNVMAGYWRQPEATAASFFGEWFRTGDLGTEDDDGYFSILDRKKDLIIVNGMNVYPRVVEEVLYRHPAVREAAVVGEPHALHGEIPVAFVSLRADARVTPALLRAYCRESLGRHEVPRRVDILTDLPKNAAGKILKRALRITGEIERGVDCRPAGDD